jgi:hypothetical protein
VARLASLLVFAKLPEPPTHQAPRESYTQTDGWEYIPELSPEGARASDMLDRERKKPLPSGGFFV